MELKSVGMMTFPTEWKNKNVPNHQSAKYPTWESSEKWGVPSMYGSFVNMMIHQWIWGYHYFQTNPFI
jgi:hypothetical protein